MEKRSFVFEFSFQLLQTWRSGSSRILRWMDEEEDKLKSSGESSLQYLVIDMSAAGSIGTFEEVKKILERRGIKLILANSGSEVMNKLDKSKFIEPAGPEWIFSDDWRGGQGM